MNRIVASFGGFLGRKHDREPGIKAIWIGLQRLKDFTSLMRLFAKSILVDKDMTRVGEQRRS
jgi:hypothetical protein